jgi:DNA-binding CsgD family transcriptional regulator
MADACRNHAGRALRIGRDRHARFAEAWAHAALVLLALGEQDTEGATEHGDALLRLTAEVRHPGWLWWQADVIEALHGAGRCDDARILLARLEREAGDVDSAWGRAAAARCRGVLGPSGRGSGGAGPSGRGSGGAGRSGSGSGGADTERSFTLAVEGFRGLGAAFEEARSLALRGGHRIRTGSRDGGGADLARARSLFDRLGARAWSERLCPAPADEPLSALAARLTPAELRVAIPVARGASNREAAAALFLSAKTVDSHLRSIYRKLAVRNRAQLAGVVAELGSDDR